MDKLYSILLAIALLLFYVGGLGLQFFGELTSFENFVVNGFILNTTLHLAHNTK